MGFISRQEAEEYLHKSETGTFLIRFSDSELGGVTVAWITGLYHLYFPCSYMFSYPELPNKK